MSSSYVRTQIKNFITANLPLEKLVDISSEYDEIGDMLEDQGAALGQPWIGIQFLSALERPVSTPATNTTGKFREIGSVLIHIVEPSKLGVINAILPRAEAVVDLFRSQRIGRVIVEEVTPLNTSAGSTLTFQRGFSSGTIIVSYHSDKDL